ncbi:MAG: DUF4345 family protein [Bacteroidia bacterium]|nr:DUF4345 family protein [Bacteroidia bacterium]
MTTFYLYLNSFIYLIFSAWCLFKPKDTAEFSGFTFLNNSGKVEYLAVYGGMELGFCVFFGLCALLPNLRFAGLVFGVCMYVGLILVRTISAVIYGNLQKGTYIIGGLELLLGIWGIVLLLNEMKRTS